MVGENFKYLSSQMAKIALKFTTMVGKIFKYQYSQMTKIGFKFSTMVGEIFKYLYSQMAKIVYLTNLSITCSQVPYVKKSLNRAFL